jgi:hypothetical protein
MDEYMHPQHIMESLGITYQYATPQSLYDSWWFWNCENIPDKLPRYLTAVSINPMSHVGNGINERTARIILSSRTTTKEKQRANKRRKKSQRAIAKRWK